MHVKIKSKLNPTFSTSSSNILCCRHCSKRSRLTCHNWLRCCLVPCILSRSWDIWGTELWKSAVPEITNLRPKKQRVSLLTSLRFFFITYSKNHYNCTVTIVAVEFSNSLQDNSLKTFNILLKNHLHIVKYSYLYLLELLVAEF